MPGHRKREELTSTRTYDEKRKQALECQRRTTQRSIAAMASAWLRRNVRQVWDGGPLSGIMYLEAVDSAISNRSLSSSPWMRGAHHNGFSVLIRRMSSRNSRLTVGLPGRSQDFQRQ